MLTTKTFVTLHFCDLQQVTSTTWGSVFFIQNEKQMSSTTQARGRLCKSLSPALPTPVYGLH